MLESISNRWRELSTLHRGAIIVAILAIAAVATWGMLWVARDDYQVLFADLNPRDASAMVAVLDRMKLPYRLSEEGTAILVERDAVYKTRLKLMGKGLDLHGGVGFEIFSSSDFGASDFSQRVNYQRALQGELVRTIMGFDEVKLARVHLVLPESGLFRKNSVKPKASISLTMRGDRQLSSEQVVGIQRLVAASVPEIEAGAVTVVDHRGIAISKNSAPDAEAELAQGKLEVKQQVEGYLRKKIADILDQAFGPGRAIVSVDAVVNFDQVQSQREDVIPAGKVGGQQVGVVAKQRVSIQGNGKSAAGQARTPVKNVDVPGREPISQKSEEVEYANSKRVQQVIYSTGGIKRLSVGVIVPTSAEAGQVGKLKDVIAMAVGLNPARGDGMAIMAADWKGEPTASSASAAPGFQADAGEGGASSQAPANERGGNPAIPVLVALALGVAAIGWVYARRPRAAVAPIDPGQREALLGDIRRWLAADPAEAQRG